MHSTRLHAALHGFATEAAATLAAMVAAGDEIPFEVVEEGAGHSRRGLFCWQPRTGEFVERHWAGLERLGSAAGALAALRGLSGLDAYLETYAAERRAGASPAEDALRCFAHRVFDGVADFELAPERFEPAFRELSEAALPDGGELAVAALLRGIACESAEVALSEGSMLVAREALEALPPDAAWREHDGAATVIVLTPGTGPRALEEVLDRLRDVQTAIRLYAPGVALAPLAWIRGQRDAQERTGWRALPIPGGGRGDGAIVIPASGEEELRLFAALVARRRPVEGEVAWALERFELGCERDDPLIGLTDHLLALRALLEPEGPRSGRLAGRIAALCALPEDRTAVTERIARAISLEQSLVAGVPVGPDATTLAAEIEQYLRAVLRDVVCGHLNADLTELADALLHEQIEPEPEPDPDPTGEMRITRVPRPGELDLDEEELAFAFEDYGAADGEVSFTTDGP